MMDPMRAVRSIPAHRLAVAGFLTMALLTMAGCSTASAPRHTVRITSAVDPSAKTGYAYTLAQASAGRTQSDAFHTEVTQRVRTALAQRGMYEAVSTAKADIVISFDYGEYPPQTQVTTVTEPVFVNSGMMGGMGGIGDPLASGSSSLRSRGGLPSSQPSVVMVETLRVTQTSEKYFRIEARENSTGKTRAWTVDATIEDEGTPISDCIPAMVDAVIEYIGYKTPQPEKIVIRLGPDGPTR